MKIYRNPWVSRHCYFVPTGTARSANMEAAKRDGITVTLWNGEWMLRKSQMYVKTLDEMPVVGEISKTELESTVIASILGKVKHD